jgi:N-acyl-D-amino-acid deacylase
MRSIIAAAVICILFGFNLKSRIEYDIIIRNGTIYDGTGADPYVGDVAISFDTIAAIGDLSSFKGKKEIDAKGLAVAPGFINMLSWADESLLRDGRSLSDIKQGVTLEVFGEGFSQGPTRRKNPNRVDSIYTTLGGYFKWITKKGVSPNVASFVGASSVRTYVLDRANRAPNEKEMDDMKYLVKQAMEQGAMGLGSSLIYAPATYASTKELTILCKVASKYGGMYITHMRSEGDFILRAMDETLRIARDANIPTEIYHLKINIARNWSKIDTLLYKIDSAKRAGLKITANMYPYTASGTGLNTRLPTWVQEGGAKEMRKRLSNQAIRKKVLHEMRAGIPYKNSDPENVVLMNFRLDSLDNLYKGKRLSEVAKMHGKDADETVIDLIVKDKSAVDALFHLQAEANVRKIMRLPFVSFGSDAMSIEIPPAEKRTQTHPRLYGTFARVLGTYVREEKLLTLQEAIRRLTALPASNLKLKKRGKIEQGFFADLAIFDPDTIKDLATFENPHQYSVGMVHVFVNGTQVLADGEHTKAKPGRVIRGPGYKP